MIPFLFAVSTCYIAVEHANLVLLPLMLIGLVVYPGPALLFFLLDT